MNSRQSYPSLPPAMTTGVSAWGTLPDGQDAPSLQAFRSGAFQGQAASTAGSVLRGINVTMATREITGKCGAFIVTVINPWIEKYINQWGW